MVCLLSSVRTRRMCVGVMCFLAVRSYVLAISCAVSLSWRAVCFEPGGGVIWILVERQVVFHEPSGRCVANCAIQ